jgi:hypothetical protein
MNLYFALARQAMCAGMRLLGAQHGDRVAVPKFICSDVPKSLVHEGLHVVYYDITTELQPDTTQSPPDARFMLIVNYFGFPADIDSVKTKWGFADQQLVEDNAHGLLSCDQDGRLLGHRSSVGFTSFRKSLRVSDGGILHVSPTVSINTESELLEPVHRPKSVGQKCRRSISALSTTLHLPLMNTSRLIKRALGLSRSRPFDPSSIIPDAVSTDSLQTLKSCNATNEAARRVSLYEELLPLVTRYGGQAIHPSLSKGTVPYALPFFATPAVAKRVQQQLWLRDREVFRWPDLPITPGHQASWYANVYLISFL